MRARTIAPVAAASLLAGCAGSPGSPARPDSPVRLVAYDGCAPLLDGLREATAARVGPYGLGGAVPLLRKGVLPENQAEGAAPNGATPDAQAAAPQHSTTNAHEPGADEPDIVKTDGRRIVALARGRLQVIDAASRKVVHTVSPPGKTAWTGDAQLLLSGDRVLVLSQRMPIRPLLRGPRPGIVPGGAITPQTDLTLIDLAGTPKVVGTMTSGTAYVDARQTGSVARIVVRSTPDIDFPPPKGPAGSQDDAVRRNRETVRKAPLDAWLPAFQVSAGGGPARTFRTPCEQVSRPASYTGTSMLTVLTVDLARGLGDPSAIGVAADGTTVYGNGSSLYVTGAPARPLATGRWAAPFQESTDVYKFDIRGAGRPRYVASGEVPGRLPDQYSLSEYDGDLRLATTSTGTKPDGSASQSSVFVLAQHGARLDRIGRVDGLGKGERLYAVRFIGTMAYAVTFRQIDPLYAVDLKDPRRPRVTGALKISGYSAYLHPLADGRLLGIGQDATRAGRPEGLQVSLFDVSGTPRRVGVHKLAGATSESEFEPHAFLYWAPSGLVVVPVTSRNGGRGEALALKIDGTGIREAGTIQHPAGDLGGAVRRSVMVGNTLWTFSDDGARATDATALRGGAWIRFTGA
ncbi:beta-propeller domain-containing protein [Actinomadura violacea]|uniref:Beta-propeller domain-containing protein n=1 Tax=Actinomadura violacea TaxID=2819934 RepID=A0ABS3S487_9ACTN|nr:beta-propeller domain-containing protein [Actinomadura violacea]MBO2463060.1 beta-propeller domain-containing protein [Actinomadura violacea]